MEEKMLVSGLQTFRKIWSESYGALFLCCFAAVLLLNVLQGLIKELFVWTLSKVLISLQVSNGVIPDHTPNGIVHRRLLTFLGKHCEADLAKRHKSFFDASASKHILSFFSIKFDFSDDLEYMQAREPGLRLGYWEQLANVDKIFCLKTGAGYGVNYVRYKGALLRVNRHVIEPSGIASPKIYNGSGHAGGSYRGYEMLTLTTFTWNKAILLDILESVKPKMLRRDNSKITVYQPHHYFPSWDRLARDKRKRGIDTVVLDDDLGGKVIRDVKRFLKAGNFYLSKGIPFRRHYLFHGPPGCGKSSIVKAIAGELNFGICSFSLSQKMSDTSLINLFNWTPKNCVILMEDIDAAFSNREQVGASNLAYEGNSASKLTFGGLLNLLDGVASAENGQIVFMTTNYLERLDPALLRPGRIDVKVHMDWPTDSQIVGLFNKFYPELENKELGLELVLKMRALVGEKSSLAMLQNLLVVYRNNPKGALENFEKHFKEFYSE